MNDAMSIQLHQDRHGTQGWNPTSLGLDFSTGLPLKDLFISTKQGCNQASRQRSKADEGLKAGLEGVKGMEAGFKAKAYLEAGVKQGEAVEIAAKQIYVYNIKWSKPQGKPQGPRHYGEEEAENLSRPWLSKLQQNSFGRSRLCELGAKQTIFQDASKQASRQPRGYRNCNKTKNYKDEGEFSRQASTAAIGANAHECL